MNNEHEICRWYYVWKYWPKRNYSLIDQYFDINGEIISCITISYVAAGEFDINDDREIEIVKRETIDGVKWPARFGADTCEETDAMTSSMAWKVIFAQRSRSR